METAFAFAVGALFAIGVYLLLQRNLIRVVFGVIILTNAMNVLIFTLGRLVRGRPPLVPEGAEAVDVVMANPLPQALILTSIVISFGLAAFTLALVYRSEKTFHTLNSDHLLGTERSEDSEG